MLVRWTVRHRRYSRSLAVGAIAMTFELRMPVERTRSRNAVQSRRDEKSASRWPGTRLREKFERIDWADTPDSKASR